MYKFLCRHTFSFLLGVYLGVKLLGHILNLCLTFQTISKLFSIVLHHFPIPSTGFDGSNLFTSLPTLVIIQLFNYNQASDCEVAFYCRFSPMGNDVDHFFMCLLAIYLSSLEIHLFKSFAQFLIRSFVFLSRVFYILDSS